MVSDPNFNVLVNLLTIDLLFLKLSNIFKTCFLLNKVDFFIELFEFPRQIFNFSLNLALTIPVFK